MKKNLLYFWAFVCSVTLFMACSDNDDKDDNNGGVYDPQEEAAVTSPAVVGTYWGSLDISMIPDGSEQETVIGNGISKYITLSRVSDTEVSVELKDFELFMNGTIMKFGDIEIDKCMVTKSNATTYTFSGQQNLTFEGAAAALGTCTTTVEGTVTDGDIDMNIQVKVPLLQQTVKVTYSGTKQVSPSTES